MNYYIPATKKICFKITCFIPHLIRYSSWKKLCIGRLPTSLTPKNIYICIKQEHLCLFLIMQFYWNLVPKLVDADSDWLPRSIWRCPSLGANPLSDRNFFTIKIYKSRGQQLLVVVVCHNSYNRLNLCYNEQIRKRSIYNCKSPAKWI